MLIWKERIGGEEELEKKRGASSTWCYVLFGEGSVENGGEKREKRGEGLDVDSYRLARGQKRISFTRRKILKPRRDGADEEFVMGGKKAAEIRGYTPERQGKEVGNLLERETGWLKDDRLGILSEQNEGGEGKARRWSDGQESDVPRNTVGRRCAQLGNTGRRRRPKRRGGRGAKKKGA